MSAELLGGRARRRFARELKGLALEPDTALLEPLARALADRGAGAPEVLAALAAERARGLEDGLRERLRELRALGRTLVAEAAPADPEVARLAIDLVSEAALGAADAIATRVADARVRAVTEELRAALDVIEEAVLLIDPSGEIAWSSRRMDALGREAAAAALETARLALRSRHRVGPERRRVSALDLQLRGDPIPAGGAIALVRDVTARLARTTALERADRELAVLHSRLLRVGHDRARTELAAGVALALNNDLNALALRLRLLRSQLPPEAARHLDPIDSATRAIVSQVSQLGELAARRRPSPPRPIDLDQAVVEALDLLRPELSATAQRPVRIDARLGSAGQVSASGTELRELLCSLLLVARDLVPPGGVLRLETHRAMEQGELSLAHATARAAPSAETSVARGAHDVDTAPEVELAAATESAIALGGTLEIGERAGTTTYVLRLPSAHAPAKETPAPAPAAGRPAARVLIVDDDAGNREALGELLELSGFRVDAVASPSEAVAAVRTTAYDAALLDLAMPELNGWELAKRLRALDERTRGDRPRLRLALVTGWDGAAAEQPPGLVDAVFQKPIDLPAIVSFIEHRPAPPVYSPAP